MRTFFTTAALLAALTTPFFAKSEIISASTGGGEMVSRTFTCENFRAVVTQRMDLTVFENFYQDELISRLTVESVSSRIKTFEARWSDDSQTTHESFGPVFEEIFFKKLRSYGYTGKEIARQQDFPFDLVARTLQLEAGANRPEVDYCARVALEAS